MFLSVVVPVYNSESTLEQTIRSLFAQSCSDFEIIAVNDGSQDGSSELLSQLKEESPVRFVIVSQENQGLSGARNTGLSRARGRYVYFLDADDFVEPCLVEHAKEYLDSEEIDVLIFDMDFYHHTEERFIPRQSHDLCPENFGTPREVFDYTACSGRVFESFHNWVWNKIFRMEFLKAEDLYFGKSICTEDFPFTGWALIRAKKMLFLDEVLVHYRVFRGESAMDRRDHFPLDMVETFIEFRQRLVQRGYYSQVEEAYIRWTLQGLFSNINMFQTPEAYQIITDFLSRGGWRMLGLESCKPEYIEESDWVVAYHLLHDKGPLYYARWDKRMVERHRDEIMNELRATKTELQATQESLDATRTELEYVRKEDAARIDYLETRFEHRFGRALFAPLRAVKNALDVRKSKGEEVPVVEPVPAPVVAPKQEVPSEETPAADQVECGGENVTQEPLATEEHEAQDATPVKAVVAHVAEPALVADEETAVTAVMDFPSAAKEEQSPAPEEELEPKEVVDTNESEKAKQASTPMDTSAKLEHK